MTGHGRPSRAEWRHDDEVIEGELCAVPDPVESFRWTASALMRWREDGLDGLGNLLAAVVEAATQVRTAGERDLLNRTSELFIRAFQCDRILRASGHGRQGEFAKGITQFGRDLAVETLTSLLSQLHQKIRRRCNRDVIDVEFHEVEPMCSECIPTEATV